MASMPLRRGHFRVLAVASMGQVTGAGLSTLVGIVLPMIQLMRHPELSSLQQGLVACTSLTGITVGSLLFGRLSDRYGYLFFLRLCPILVLAASLLAFFADNLPGLVVGLFFMGLGIGGEYSLDSDYISEIMPRRWRLLMVGVAKASSSLGNIFMALACFLLLRNGDNPAVWNRLLLMVSALAVIMIVSRIRFAQSPGWLMARGRVEEAEAAVRFFLGNDVEVVIPGTAAAEPDRPVEHRIGPDLETGEIRNRRSSRQKDIPLRELFSGTNLKKVILSGVPWACEGLGVYGIGVFLPMLVLALGIEQAGSGTAAPFSRIIESVKTTTWINLSILPGFVLGLLLVNRWSHIRIQTWGFILCAFGLLLLLAAYRFHLPTALALTGFMIFEIFLNAGPHLMTFILPSQIYPVADRGEGAGVAAAIGKIGAIIGVLFMPLLLSWGGATAVLLVTAAVQIAGAAVTGLLGRKIVPLRTDASII